MARPTYSRREQPVQPQTPHSLLFQVPAMQQLSSHKPQTSRNTTMSVAMPTQQHLIISIHTLTNIKTTLQPSPTIMPDTVINSLALISNLAAILYKRAKIQNSESRSTTRQPIRSLQPTTSSSAAICSYHHHSLALSRQTCRASGTPMHGSILHGIQNILPTSMLK